MKSTIRFQEWRSTLVNTGKRRYGFTLVELLVSMAVLSLIMAMMLGILGSIQRQTSRSTGNIEAFRAARNAFEAITRRISQATLNTYWAYDDPVEPTRYQRASELRFLSGNAADLIGAVDPENPTEERFGQAIFFQAPLGQVDDAALEPLDSILNTWGYYVEYNSDEEELPDVLNLTEKRRFRLMELREPSEDLTVYTVTSGDPSTISRDWMSEPMDDGQLQHPLVDNVLALVILPKLAKRDDDTGLALVNSSGNYLYDSALQGQGIVNPFYSSKHQLPPLVEVTLVAIDESSAIRLENSPDLDSFLNLMANLFIAPDMFQDDLEILEAELTDRNLTYRVFSTEVPIQGSKWSVE